MNNSQEKLQKVMSYALENRPKIGGFPFLAECLRNAGVTHNLWSLPGAQSIYIMKEVAVVQQGEPLLKGMADVALFDESALIAALRADQAGLTTFPEFLSACWQAGVIGYDVDFTARTVSYAGSHGECYTESYPAVVIGDMSL